MGYENYKPSALTAIIIKCFYEVYNKLGYGFLEKVYENALIKELQNADLFVEKQKPIKVFYQDEVVSEYFADIFVENKIIIELKVAESLAIEHEFQLINYLKATEMEVGLLLNFGKKAQFKRKVFSNNHKK